jgi:uncharacterized protein YbjT (DUF2867 family)
MARTVLITGATGQIGSALTHTLRQGGWRVRALVRDEERARRRLGNDVELVRGDLTSPGSVRPALKKKKK